MAIDPGGKHCLSDDNIVEGVRRDLPIRQESLEEFQGCGVGQERHSAVGSFHARCSHVGVANAKFF